MIDNFHEFATAVNARFANMSALELFVVDNDRDVIWDTYLRAFPEGTNPKFRERTEHDCSCCKHFIRNIGNVVGIIDSEFVTVWAIPNLPYPYNVVAEAMDLYVRQLPVVAPFRTKERSYGNEFTIEHADSGDIRWNHFHTKVRDRFVSAAPDTVIGEMRTTKQVFERGLKELSADALATVTDLIAENMLYRGEEHQAKVKAFRDLHTTYHALPMEQREAFVWGRCADMSVRFRNSVIGGLVDELSKGVELEKAVKAFEAQVAPANYKRPKALISKKMVSDAMATITKLGLEKALERRHAQITDVSVNNVLFVDNSVQSQMKDGIEGLLMEEVKAPTFETKNATAITMDAFLADVVPKASRLDLAVENGMMGNFMSLTAPVHDEPTRLFQWNNNFAWSYDGNVTDSVKQRVKAAGGNIDAAMRVSLAWWNPDDLDIHCYEPNGNHVYYGNRDHKLDVDMNAFGPKNATAPVENISWTRDRLRDGVYRITVNQYCKRSAARVGFLVEVECDGILSTFTYDRVVTGTVPVVEIEVKNGKIVNLKGSGVVTHGESSQEKWGVQTQQLVRVNTLMLSPNHWDDNAAGNRHWFFVLEGCKNPDPVRGIYNEFLSGELTKHRKVFEVLGDKMKCAASDEQLSGLGFSSTRKDKATIVATIGGKQRTYAVQF